MLFIVIKKKIPLKNYTNKYLKKKENILILFKYIYLLYNLMLLKKLTT